MIWPTLKSQGKRKILELRWWKESWPNPVPFLEEQVIVKSEASRTLSYLLPALTQPIARTTPPLSSSVFTAMPRGARAGRWDITIRLTPGLFLGSMIIWLWNRPALVTEQMTSQVLFPFQWHGIIVHLTWWWVNEIQMTHLTQSWDMVRTQEIEKLYSLWIQLRNFHSWQAHTRWVCCAHPCWEALAVVENQ